MAEGFREKTAAHIRDCRIVVLEYLRSQFENELSHEEKSRLSSWVLHTEEMEKIIKYKTCKGG